MDLLSYKPQHLQRQCQNVLTFRNQIMQHRRTGINDKHSDSNHTFIVHKCYIQEGIVNTRVHNHTRTLPLNNSAFYYYIHSFYRNNITRFVTRGYPSHCTIVPGAQICRGNALQLVRASGTHHGIVTNNKWLSVGGSDYHIS